MAAIRDRDTKPELLLRSALHRAGFRYRLRAQLPGKPDMTLARFGATIFVHGCFWHAHGCPRFRQPAGESADFWKAKLKRNVERDLEVTSQLLDQGWRQLIVWECALTGRGRLGAAEVALRVGSWLSTGIRTGEIEGEFR
jgi:DNA mismatch endonuclease (patch repair protein)